MPAKRWEYRVAEGAPRHLGMERGDLLLDLNEDGADGWEAIGMVGVGRDTISIMVLMKRPVQAQGSRVSQSKESERVVYDIEGWTSEQLAALLRRLRDENISFLVEGDELQVPTAFEHEVDRLLDTF